MKILILFFIVAFGSVAFSVGNVVTVKNAVKAVKASKKTAGVSALFVAGSYILSPEETTLQSIAEDLVDPVMPLISGETSNCDSVSCSRFVSECASQLKLPKTSTANEVSEESGFKNCIKSFFTVPMDHESKKMFAELCRKRDSQSPIMGCPLDVQSQLRGDPNLNRLLSPASPDVHDVNCSRQNPEIQVFGVNKALYTQTVAYTEAGLVEKVDRSLNSDGSSDRLFYKDGKPISLQHCEKDGKNCKIFEMKKVRSVKHYFFNGTKLTGIPHDAFEWARKMESLLGLQSTSIKDCCNDKTCQGYFTDRTKKYNENRAKETGVK